MSADRPHAPEHFDEESRVAAKMAAESIVALQADRDRLAGQLARLRSEVAVSVRELTFANDLADAMPAARRLADALMRLDPKLTEGH